MEKIFVAMEKIGSVGATKIICVSNRVMADGIRKKIAKPKKFLLIQNGIDFTPTPNSEPMLQAPATELPPVMVWGLNVENKRDEIRKNYNIKPKEIVIGMVSRLAYPKDPLLFLQIAKEILKKEKDVKFALVGSGPLSDKCHNFIEKEKLEEKILLLGEKSPLEARELFFVFDIFVLLSNFEGMPITILEAMFASLPAVVSNVGGIPELIEKGKGGFLVRNNYFGEIKEAIDYLIKNPQIRKQMGVYNLQKAKANFTLKRMVSQYESLYFGT